MTMKDCWIILGRADQKMVYDVSEYLADHPGGPEVILEQAGVMYSFAFLLTLPRERC
jgi:cytochrome b involved in lipid metabolism